jgi:hypothetical protein
MKFLDMGSHVHEPRAIVPDLDGTEADPVIPDFQLGGSFP